MRYKEFILNESINDKGIMKCMFMAGQPGAGKSYTINNIKSGNLDPRVVNIDKFVEYFKAYSDEDWEKHGEIAKLLTKNQFALYLNGLLPLWVDCTSSSAPAVLRRKGILSSLGYDTGMIWVNCSLETALKRAAQRERVVPDDHIKETYETIQKMKTYYQQEFKFFLEIDNDDGELTNDIILKAFKKTTNFFMSPIENPIGKELIENMKSKGKKYLTENGYSIENVQKLIDAWYRN